MEASHKVLLIVGPGRSGSTLLERIIGNESRYFSVGEVRFFWEYIHDEYRLCGCGSNISSCPFWKQVISEVDGDQDLDLYRLQHISSRINRTGFLPRIMHFQGAYLSEINDLANAYQRMYSQIFRKVTDSIVVDSSKIGSYLYLLMKVPTIDLRVLHLVRDSRAVAYSWKFRRKNDPSHHDHGGFMRGRSLLRSSVAWLVTNHYLLKMKANLNHYALLKYEDFVSNPTALLNRALAELDLPLITRNLDTPFQLAPTHSLGGNPLRYQDSFEIKEASNWQEQLNPLQKYLVGSITYPVMRKLAYKLTGIER